MLHGLVMYVRIKQTIKIVIIITFNIQKTAINNICSFIAAKLVIDVKIDKWQFLVLAIHILGVNVTNSYNFSLHKLKILWRKASK